MPYNLTIQHGLDLTDPRAINWPARQRDAVVPFNVANGIPLNPVEPHLPEGRNGLGHWGEGVAVDPIVFMRDTHGNVRLLMIERDDDNGWAFPGGGIDPSDSIGSGDDRNETAARAMVRELAEETGLVLPTVAFEVHPGRYVPDPRAGRAAWMVTVPGVAVLHTDTPPAVTGRSDARRALWLPSGSYTELADAIAALGGRVFSAHVGLVHDLLA